jgi:hypothetical protein
VGRKVTIGAKAQRVLVFDLEARPIAWYGGDWVTKQITIAASAWTDDPEGTMEVYYLTKDSRSFPRMLKRIHARIDEADVVSGHYIRGFDLPLLNGNLFLSDLPLLGPVLTQDTKGELPKMGGMSKSMENLGGTVKLDQPKVGMNTGRWWEANTLEPEGMEYARGRAMGDVLENIELRAELLRRGALGPPKLWHPGDTHQVGAYTP